MKRTKIYSILLLTAFTILAAACNAAEPEEENIGMANPASVYCEDQGGTLEIREGDGGQYGVCIFPDGSECEEWAYFNGECAPVSPSNEEETDTQAGNEVWSSELTKYPFEVVAMYGKVVSADRKGPSESVLAYNLDGADKMFITGENAEIEAQIMELMDKPQPANHANFWGVVNCPDVDNCLLTVSRLRVDGPGEFPAPDVVEGWEGVIYSGPEGPRSGGDDYFALNSPLPLQYGLHSLDEEILAQIESLRDSGQGVRIWGEVYAGRPDWNGTQIEVTRIETFEIDPAVVPPAPSW